MGYFPQIFWHGINVLTFRHRGEGLQNCSVSNCYLLVAISTVMMTLTFACEYGTLQDTLISLVIHVIYIGMVAKMFGKPRLAGVCCLFTVFAIIRMFNATVASSFIGPQNTVFHIWELAALVFFIMKAGEQQR